MPASSPIQLSDEQIDWLRNLKMSKRAAIVRDHILENGSVTTADLNAIGYDHPPRAVRDLKDAGAGVAKEMVVVGGKRMARYFFDGTANKDERNRLVRPKAFSDALKAANGYRCEICRGVFPARALQDDHRIPFAIAGDPEELNPDDWMPLCASDNRAKSWSCEHCPNWIIRDADTCKSCFWAHPEKYEHVETRPERRLNLIFQGDEVQEYERLRSVAEAESKSVPELAKEVLAEE